MALTLQTVVDGENFYSCNFPEISATSDHSTSLWTALPHFPHAIIRLEAKLPCAIWLPALNRQWSKTIKFILPFKSYLQQEVKHLQQYVMCYSANPSALQPRLQILSPIRS